MSTRPELWWRSQPHTLTWICASSTWQVSRAWGAKWQPDKEGGCTGNSCWDRGDLDQAVLRAAAWVALHSSVHLICHYHRTRALQASRDGQRKARIDKEAPHHVMNSLLRHIPWQLHTRLFSTWHRGWPCLPAVSSEGDLSYCQEPALAMGGRTCHTINSSTGWKRKVSYVLQSFLPHTQSTELSK